MADWQTLLSCWHKLEHYTPAELPKDKSVKQLQEKLPWNLPLTSKDEKKTIVYTIYIDVHPLSSALEFVRDYFQDESLIVEVNKSLMYYASLKLNEQGRYIQNSLGISTFPWALHQLEKGKLQSDSWSESFQMMCTNLLEYLEQNRNELEDDFISYFSEVQTLDNLQEIQSIIRNRLGWRTDFAGNIYMKADEVYKSAIKEDDSSNSDLLNSFFISDIERVISAFQNGQVGKSVRDYIRGCFNENFKHEDLRENPEIIKYCLVPDNFPDGCWPSKYKASLMQQFAVNMIYEKLVEKEGMGVFSVNGPPGTGKTTLLRDVIASILVKRAKALVQYEEPANAFTKIGQVSISDEYTPFIYEPDETICGAGMVIASSNNGAVENISKELPLKKEVEPYADSINYFRMVSETCLDKEYWGVIAATLGNKENRRILVNRIWSRFEQEASNVTLADYLGNNKISNEEWQEARRVFQEKLQVVQAEKERLNRCIKDNDDYEEKQQKCLSLEIRLQEAKNQRNDLEYQKEKLEKEKLCLEERLRELTFKWEIVKQNRPGFWKSLRRGVRKQYRETLNEMLNALDEVTSGKQKCEEGVLSCEDQIVLLKKIDVEYEDCRNKLLQFDKKIEVARKELNAAYADMKFWENIESHATQESCPWYSNQLKKLQSELFVAAMHVNEMFILRANAKSSRIKPSLDGFFQYLKGGTMVSQKEIEAMWKTFWLVIPVVSTTFASVSRMFADLGQGSIPWLFIDEAGQAVPQAALGAIWRARRVVVVGDPFQIEPVVTIPEVITKHINDYFNLDLSQVHPSLSVQSMADRVNQYGWVSNDTWIGVPLRVHRRCLDPMFFIANKIAYQGMMYNSTIAKEPEIRLQTHFVHVTGRVDGRHYVPEQGELVLKLLLDEISGSDQLPDVFVISPFAEIPRKLKVKLQKSLQEALKLDKENSNILHDWLKSHVGTVHTFQGKQASGVILCLGLDEQSKGAASWASSKPNLLNVALTRAKHRFVAIGDKDIWLKQPYFSELRLLGVCDGV